MLENIIVGVIVGAVTVLAGLSVWRALKGKGGGCGRCRGCDSAMAHNQGVDGQDDGPDKGACER